MKKYLLFILVLCLNLFTQIIYSQIPSYVPTSGIVGYWPFNGNANDESGNGNNGTVNGATLATDRFGNVNSAYNFNGISNNISIPDSNTLSNMTSITISSWVYINQWYMSNNQGWFPILSKSNSSSYGKYRLGAFTGASNGYPSIYGNLKTNATGITQNNLYSINQWNHIVLTISNGTSSIFLNGIQVFNGATTATGWSTIDNLPLIIGKDSPGTIDYANGTIDDIGIWNRILTQQEITNMFNGVNYSDTCNAVSGSLTNGLVGYWPFCGNANDDSGNGNNGVVDGATLTTDRFGNANSAYSFNGSNKIAVPNLQSYLFNSKITISAWVNLSSIPNSKFNLVTKYGGGAGFDDAFSLDVLSTNYQLNISPGSTNWTTCVGNSSIQTNQWHNLVGVFDYSNNIFKIYLDGVLLSSNTVLSAMGNALSAKVIFGYYDDPLLFYPNQQLNGKLDDIGIWNRALTQQEITQLFNQNQCTTNITVTDTLIINVGQLSYSNPVAYANNITLYPNPANTQVNISFNNITDLTGGNINIVNSLGQQVATTPITLSGTNTTMPLNTWGGTGLYFVQIVNAQGQILDIKKIILQ